jgi:hypothetical protein
MTWFRKEPGMQWRSVEDTESPAQVAERIVGEVRRFLAQLDADKLTSDTLDKEHLSA